MNQKLVEKELAGLSLGGIRFFDVVSSTNDMAREWAEEGAADGSLVITESQTKGRGRFGRRWVTEPGASLAISLILRPTPFEVEMVSHFSSLGALAICEALSKEFPLNPQIKWPNDVLLDRKKIAGLLVEINWLGTRIQSLILGIGINIAPTSVPPAGELLFPATCIETVLGHSIDRISFLRSLLSAIQWWRSRIFTTDFYQAWQNYLAFKGEKVRVAPDQETPGITGILTGIAPDGSLILQGEDGKDVLIQVGEVHLRPAEDKA